jgi:hypothetical protein
MCDRNHALLMESIDEALFKRKGKHQVIVHKYSDCVTVDWYRDGEEQELYRCYSLSSAIDWAQDRGFDFIVSDIKHLGRKWQKTTKVKLTKSGLVASAEVPALLV